MSKVKQAFFLLCLIAAPSTWAFSLLGPYAPWQVEALTYNWPGVDLGAPMNIGEGFRWNVPVITYAFDRSFINYFGPEGVKAVEEAIDILNDLPAAGKISDDLSEYSTQTLRENYEAEALGIFDLKSAALHLMVEELGLADPVRFAYTLRGRETRTVGGVTITNYLTAFRNFDPVTLASTPVVNGSLYTFEIQEYELPFQHADAVEFLRFDNDAALESVPVATGTSRDPSGGPNAISEFGVFRTGLSRDDVGGLRYLYHSHNYAVESLLPTVSLGSSVGNRSSWVPFLGVTNAAGVTNTIIGPATLTNAISTGLRGGINKLRLQRVFFDSILGSAFTPITNAYTDVLVATNNQLVVQPLLRAITQPDIVFSAGDLGFFLPGLLPVLIFRTDTGNWVDNDAQNGSDEVGTNARGPGVITPQVVISFSDQFPALASVNNAFLGSSSGEDASTVQGYWGSFDGSTNAPIIYSQSGLLSIQQLRAQVLGGAQR